MNIRYRLYIAKMGHFADEKAYEFVAEFSDEQLAANYCNYMRTKRRWKDYDIIARKEMVDESTTLIETRGIVTVMGESLPLDEYGIK